ncbi:uncharacterized protein LOC111618700 [Centruroides sculpturatus]|uniref:uncharacterized protein LOC111618700 n=1 Tax=Centruroides sculpturatus TaxID=218467 RepID=UPI000C6DEB05|nr:uncharacterized protein LOC111618700 [Centruroides sculpturatus]XP_023216039.1 uncharacterized protein LOC111618700 [Centruroides sculpturatus]XP_023216040.1 uncharacterized protein LOC111618700 [Centruroides sculpturatus]
MMQSNEYRTTDAITQSSDLKTRKQLESEVLELKKRVQVSEKTLKNVEERYRLHTSQTNQLFLSMKNRIRNQEEVIKYLTKERDILVKNFISNLLLLESGLRKEQKEIQNSLDDKDRIIERLNRELQNIKSTKCIKVEESELCGIKSKINDAISDDMHDSGIEMTTVLESTSQNQLYFKNSNNFQDFHVDSGIKARHLYGSYERLTEIGIKTAMGCYNRLFNNHRSVTKPRDVKQRRIFRRGSDNKQKTI